MTADTDTPRRLVRSDSDRIIAGVCGGLAAHLDVDATLVRAVFVLLALAHGIGLVIYVVLAAITPRASEAGRHDTRDVVRDNMESARSAARRAGHDLRATYRRYAASGDAEPAADPPQDRPDTPVGAAEPAPPPPPPHRPPRSRGPWGLGLLLVIVGLVLLARNLGFFFWIDWGTWWPVILIGAGAWMLARRIGDG